MSITETGGGWVAKCCECCPELNGAQPLKMLLEESWINARWWGDWVGYGERRVNVGMVVVGGR